LLVADCARHAPPPATSQSTARPQSAAARPTPGAPGSAPAGAATLVPPDLALAFLQELKSAGTPACRFTEKGTWSAGEYRKITGQRASTQIASYSSWALTKIEDANGREFLPADLERAGAWSYFLRTPRTARTPFGIADQCVLGPTGEPARKVVEALTALGVAIPPELAYIVR
jgi:hypothetical protein